MGILEKQRPAAWSRPSMAFVPFFLLLALDLPSLLLAQSRDSEPLVVTGEQVDLPVSPHLLVGFRREEGSWVQVPVQVDERHEVDWDAVKQVDCRVHLRELTSLLYSDPETFAGSDPDPTFDQDDELVFMFRDVGTEQYDKVAEAPEGVHVESMRELLISDPQSQDPEDPVGFIYLFEAREGSECPSSGCLEGSAGEMRVRYNFTLTKRNNETGSNAYKDVYAFDNRGNKGGGNPEDSTVETLFYSRHWRENWLSDKLSFATGEDFLLLHDFQFTPTNCGRHVGTFRKSRTGFIANKSGPLRAIRSWVGANSGTLTQRETFMYEAREDHVTHLRVHPIPGLMEYVMFQPDVPLTWFNGKNREGVSVDGVMDEIDKTFSPWQLVTSEWGSYLRSYKLEQDIFPGLGLASAAETFYVDNRTPLNTTDSGLPVHPGNWHQCCSSYMNTTVAWGVSGMQLQDWLPGVPNTDPNRGKPYADPVPDGQCKGGHDSTVNLLRLHLRQLFREPGLGASEGEELHSVLENPLTVSVTA